MTNLIDATTLRLATLDELRELNRMVVEAVRAREIDVSRAFKFGDRVRFTTKTGRTVTGSVAKINLKTIKVRSLDVLWSVTPSLLERV
jgi:hypothetical protein